MTTQRGRPVKRETVESRALERDFLPDDLDTCHCLVELLRARIFEMMGTLPVEAFTSWHLSVDEARAYAFLKARRGSPVTKEAIYAALYGLKDDPPKGGSVKSLIFRLRTKLPKTERIRTTHFGRGDSGYLLEH